MPLQKVFIIAEAGVNHNGSLDMALDMVDAAAVSGADAVKFQTFQADLLTTAAAPMAEYQKGSVAGNSQQEMLKRLELTRSMHEQIMSRCALKGIEFMSTPFDLPSIALLEELGMKIFKIPSGQITDYPYLVKIAKTGFPVILSTGMSTFPEIHEALSVLFNAGVRREQVTLLQATSAYPTPFGDVHLRAMGAMAQEFGTPVGLSDHTPGIEVSIAAVALGAAVIEKHFTLDKTLPGPDHKASLDTVELTALVKGIRHVELALGSPVKKAAPSEAVNANAARKSIVAAQNIRKGEVFSAQNLTTKRPGNGISPMMWPKLLGRTVQKDFKADEQITPEGAGL